MGPSVDVDCCLVNSMVCGTLVERGGGFSNAGPEVHDIGVGTCFGDFWDLNFGAGGKRGIPSCWGIL